MDPLQSGGANATHAGQTSTASVARAPAAPARVLVVDDNDSNREVLARRLQREFHIVETATGGTEALEKMGAENFDLILLDLMMPEMDGYEVLHELKSDEILQHIPVIMISALGETETVVRCIEMGAEDYLPKPFNPTILRARINACLHKKRAHDREMELFTELEQNYARLRRIEQQRDDLMHMIVHDLRSPLSANLAGLEMIDMLGPLSPQQRDCLSIAMRSGENLLWLINDLLDISKMENGSIKLERTEVDARHAIAIAADQVSPLLADKELRLVRQLDDNLPRLHVDEMKLQRILVNLLSNAIKFTPRGGEITVAARAGEAEILFGICDTGEGIPADAIDSIFEKFGQVEARKAGRQNSTGLGLTFCKLAAEAHGGRIWVESAPGQGSSFFFTLPSVRSS